MQRPKPGDMLVTLYSKVFVYRVDSVVGSGYDTAKVFRVNNTWLFSTEVPEDRFSVIPGSKLATALFAPKK